MDHKTKNDIKKANNVLIKSNDPRFNYSFHQDKDIENFHHQPEIITSDRYDYSVKKDDGSDGYLPSLISLSQLSAGDDLDLLSEFYRDKFPNLPDEYHGILARYSTGQLLTKKETKNAIKKSKKPNKKLPVGFEVAQGPFTIELR
jgi:hypothetical protein